MCRSDKFLCLAQGSGNPGILGMNENRKTLDERGTSTRATDRTCALGIGNTHLEADIIARVGQ